MAALCYVHAGEHTLTVHHGKGKRARVVPISARHLVMSAASHRTAALRLLGAATAAETISGDASTQVTLMTCASGVASVGQHAARVHTGPCYGIPTCRRRPFPTA